MNTSRAFIGFGLSLLRLVDPEIQLSPTIDPTTSDHIFVKGTNVLSVRGGKEDSQLL